MAGNKLTIKLTDDQQNQIYSATGRMIKELNIDAAATSQLTDKELDQVAGGVSEIVITKNTDSSSPN
jgi:bacteriocin-like protein